MMARIRKWGNSLGVRIPKSLAEDVHIRDGVEVDIRVENGCIVLTPPAEPCFQLADLLEAVSPENLHETVDTGPVLGREIW